MGAWGHIKNKITQVDLKVIAQHESSSPATGSSQTHSKRINSIFDQVFALSKQKAQA